MAFTFDEAIGKIGTPEYSGVDGLKRLVQLTSGDIDPTVAKVVKNPIYLFFFR